ncbi:MAG: hypothetical protein WDM92_03900 [Caulobacteraceae bacterium]
MKTSSDRILTTHVGSLPRSQAVTDVLFARDAGAPLSEGEATIAEAVRDVVRRQVEAGVDVVSDGEMSKISYATYIKDRLTGFDGDTPREPGLDLIEFPRILKKLADSGATAKYKRPRCVGEIRVKDMGPAHVDIANLQAALAETPPVEAFLNAASPGVIALFQPNDFYRTQDEYLEAVAEAMRAEYEAVAAGGVLLQIDAPDLGMGRHTMYKDRTEQDYLVLAERHVEVLNHALRNIPADRIRMHMCWGKLRGTPPPRHPDAPAPARRRQGQAPGPAVRGGQPAPRARVGGVRGDRRPRGQDPDPRRHHLDHQLHRPPRADRRTALPVRRHRRARAGDRRLRLRLLHLRRLRPGGPGRRLREIPGHGGGRAPGQRQAVGALTAAFSRVFAAPPGDRPCRTMLLLVVD